MPNERITQEPIRVLTLPGDGNARVTQEPIRVLTLPGDGDARISQEPIRVITLPMNGDSRITQAAIRVLMQNVSAPGGGFRPAWARQPVFLHSGAFRAW